ncbi:MAG TPA: Uma2 family endonuclease [Spirochaetia bacterium]|nr:Uma2 family endonuclease [Spirochaetia bacterium]
MGEPARKTDRRYTYGESCTWNDEERWELIDGVAWNMSPAPRERHQRYLIELGRQIANFLVDRECRVYPAPFDVVLPDYPEQSAEDSPTVVQPDICVICDRSKITEAGCTGAPDLVVEILSPSTSRKDAEIKRKLYERHGVREYWIVDPGNLFIHVYLLEKNGAYPQEPALYVVGTRPEQPLLESAVLEGFVLDLNLLFAE